MAQNVNCTAPNLLTVASNHATVLTTPSVPVTTEVPFTTDTGGNIFHLLHQIYDIIFVDIRNGECFNQTGHNLLQFMRNAKLLVT